MFVVFVATSLTLSLSIAWVVRREDHDGLSSLIFALALHAAAYTLFALRGRIPDVLSIGVGNVAMVASHSLLVFATGEFQRRRISRWLLLGPVLVIALAFSVFMHDIVVRVAIASAVFLFLDMVLLAMLFGGLKKHVGRGQHLLIAGVAINLLIVVYRVFGVFSDTRFSFLIAEPSAAQTLVYLPAFVSLNLIAIGFVLMAKESADEKTRLMAMTDKLTNCWNRFRIEEAAHQEMLRLQRYATPVSLIMIDIDHFKPINDKFGHASGDALLKALAAVAQACIRNTDTFGRWGGEEFVVLLPASGFSAAADTAERIRKAIEESEFLGGIRMTASLGVSSCLSSDSWDEWLQRADTALYQAKAQGRNRVVAEMPLRFPSEHRRDSRELLQIVWRPDYETGCQAIDAQHRLLFDHGNRLLDAMVSGAPKDATEKRIAEFVAFTRNHMRSEEEILKRSRFPGCAAHCELHRQLIDRALLLMDRYTHDQLPIGELLHFVVYEFTAQHLLIEDRKFEPYVRAASA